MFVKYGKRVLAAISVPSTLWFITDSRPIRSLRLRFLMSQGVPNVDLNGAPFVRKEPLWSDLTKSMSSQVGGVKLLWGIQGSGKTTTVRVLANQLLNEDRISGAIIIKPPDDAKICGPAGWFRSQLSDDVGQLLKADEYISNLLPHASRHENDIIKPFLFIFDQFENERANEGLRVFLKTLAEDSSLTNSYVVLVVVADAVKVKEMYSWNGHQKIVMVGGRNPSQYKWGKYEVDAWVTAYAKTHERELGDADIEHIREKAVQAGTPAFLVHTLEDVSCSAQQDIAPKAEYYAHQWDAAAKILCSLFTEK